MSTAERKANLMRSGVQCAPTSILSPSTVASIIASSPALVTVCRKRARVAVGREVRKHRTVHLGVAEPGSLEEIAQIGQRPELYGGPVAAALHHGIECFGLGGILGSEAVADDHAAAGRNEAGGYRRSRRANVTRISHALKFEGVVHTPMSLATVHRYHLATQVLWGRE